MCIKLFVFDRTTCKIIRVRLYCVQNYSCSIGLRAKLFVFDRTACKIIRIL